MATKLDANLIKNAGGEAAAGTTGDTVVAIPDWTTTGSFTAIAYGDTDYDVAEPKGGGKNFFGGGPGDAVTPDTGVSTASQTIKFSGLTKQINAGDVTARLSALLGGYQTQNDFMSVTVTFLDSTGAAVGNALTITGPDAAQRKDTSELLARNGSIVVPVGAAAATVEMISTRETGEDIDGYADKLSLKLFVNTPAIAAATIGAPRMAFAAPPHGGAVLAHQMPMPAAAGRVQAPPATSLSSVHGGFEAAVWTHAGAAAMMANLMGRHVI